MTQKLTPSGVPSVKRKPRPTYDQLQAENRALKQKLDEVGDSPIRLNPRGDTLKIQDLRTPLVTVESLEVQSPSIGDTLDRSLDPERLGQGLDLKSLTSAPVQVRDLKVSLPESTINHFAAAEGAKNRVQDLRIEFGSDGEVKVSGKAHKLVNIPFQMKGFVDVAEGGKVRLRMGGGKVFGFVPIPRLLMDMAASMGGKELAQAGVEQEDKTLLIDPKRFLPENVEFQLDKIETRPGALYLQGSDGREDTQNPTVITMGPWGPIPPGDMLTS